MKKWSSYNSNLTNNVYDVIIIGSGIGGLTTGAILALRGLKVLILEKHFKIGGWTHTFRRSNYEWDVGIHYIGEVHKKWALSRKIFDLISDKKLEWSKMDKNYDRIIFPDRAYNFIEPRQCFIDDMIGYFPNEEKAILSYMKLLDDAVRSARPYFANKAMPMILGSITYPFMSKNFFKYSDKTTYDVLASLTNNEKLIGVLTGQWGDYGLPPKKSSFAMHAFVAKHYLDGGNYPTGSSRRIAETISDTIEKNGGSLAVNAQVKEIIIKSNRAFGVLMKNGDELNANTVVSNAGLMNTFENLVSGQELLNKYKNQFNSIRKTESYICLHIGLKKSSKELNLKNTNLWVYPSYDHDLNVEKYMMDENGTFPVLYISFPSLKDNSWDKSKKNYTTIEAITMSRWEWYNNWAESSWKRRGDDYKSHKEKLTKNIMSIVNKNVIGINNSIDHLELSTPLTVRDLANYQKGEMYGLNHDPQRFRQRILRPGTKIKNLFLTGQDITTVGVTSALFSGMLTASAIEKKNLYSMLK